MTEQNGKVIAIRREDQSVCSAFFNSENEKKNGIQFKSQMDLK